jgi:hypothetical protein
MFLEFSVFGFLFYWKRSTGLVYSGYGNAVFIIFLISIKIFKFMFDEETILLWFENLSGKKTLGT